MYGLPRPEEVIVIASIFSEEIDLNHLVNILQIDKKTIEEICLFYVKMDSLEKKNDKYIFKAGKRQQFLEKRNNLTHTRSLVNLLNYFDLQKQSLEKKLHESQKKIKLNTEVLLEFSRNEAFSDGNLELALKNITESLANIINVSRVSIWAYESSKNLIECLDLFEKEKKLHSKGLILYEKDFPAYFMALKEEVVINADDAHTNKYTFQFSESYLKPLQINSMLDVPFYLQGKIGGVICFEHQFDFRKWTFEEIMFATSISSMISLAYQSLQIKQDQIKIQEVNQKLVVQNEELLQQQEEILAQRDSIELKNKQLLEKDYKISANIQAAQLIQQAILPSNTDFDRLLPNYFILNMPRDVVSGDFYWLDQENERVILAVMDCTGHGVSGAFMSMIGKTLLDKIIKVSKIIEPSEILVELNKEINIALRQNDNQSGVGMDGAVISLQKKENSCQITFAGAKRPLIFNRNTGEGIQEIKGSAKSIGGKIQSLKIFEQHTLELPKGSVVYLCSDGYADQNDVNRKSLGKTKMLEILQNMSSLPLPNQKIKLEEELKIHMKDTQQRDDILIVGLCL